jgi:hypothetical protein
MNDAKYIGLDVHQATICVVVLDSTRDRILAGEKINFQKMIFIGYSKVDLRRIDVKREQGHNPPRTPKAPN